MLLDMPLRKIVMTRVIMDMADQEFNVLSNKLTNLTCFPAALLGQLQVEHVRGFPDKLQWIARAPIIQVCSFLLMIVICVQLT